MVVTERRMLPPKSRSTKPRVGFLLKLQSESVWPPSRACLKTQRHHNGGFRSQKVYESRTPREKNIAWRWAPSSHAWVRISYINQSNFNCQAQFTRTHAPCERSFINCITCDAASFRVKFTPTFLSSRSTSFGFCRGTLHSARSQTPGVPSALLVRTHSIIHYWEANFCSHEYDAV